MREDRMEAHGWSVKMEKTLVAKGGNNVRLRGESQQGGDTARPKRSRRLAESPDARLEAPDDRSTNADAVLNIDTHGSAPRNGDNLMRELESRNANIAERFRELATLTKLLVERDNGLKLQRVQIKDLEDRVTDLKDQLSRAHERHRLLVRIYEAHLLDTSGRLGRSMTAPLRRLVDLTGRKRARIRRLIERSDLFDREWYLKTYPDVATAQMDPLDHYLLHGASEGRDPSPIFSSNGYAEHNPDVAEGGVNPLVHFVLYGCFEGRRW